MIETVVLMAALGLAAKPAYAYVDPGTATIALQALIGAIAAGGVFFRSKIAAVFRFVRGKARKEDARADPSSDSDDR